MLAKTAIEKADIQKKAQEEEERKQWKQGKPGSGMPGEVGNSTETG